ncbi:hypothetical protein J4731_14500 [Providencia rettgeri]|nr:hypothetical protein [Providencia rettgeri]
MEPELPRPNPVRLPTRRELYGIRIPSLRDAELQRREEEASKREQIYQQWSTSESDQPETDDEAQQDELLRVQFLEQQRERYGEVDETDYDVSLNSLHSHDEQLQNEPMTENRVSAFTQPEIEHRWASASQQSIIRIQFQSLMRPCQSWIMAINLSLHKSKKTLSPKLI